jgi:valyl-tRNA synthetase
MSQISKAYEPRDVERKWYSRWLEDRCFHADETSSKPAYSIVIPPPNVTGMLTLGHVLNNTLQDILARRARMQGKEVLWLPGTDHAGIATQTAVEKMLRKEGMTRHDLGRDAFLKKVWEWKEKHGGIIIDQLKKLGCSCDWDRERFTMDAHYSRAVQQAFVDLFEKGCIYRGKRMVNWCPASLTALSDEEVIMTPQQSTLYYMKYEVVEEPGTFLEIATTRPETLMGDSGVAVNPNDPRYAHLVGKHCRRPFPKAEIPIVADDHIDPQFGTGVLKVTPAHDKADFEIGQRHGLEIIDVLNPDGTLNELAGEDFAGMDRFEARKEAAQKLADMGLLVREEPYINNVGISERAQVPIEPRLSEQWFLRYPQLKASLELVQSSEIGFVPARWVKVFEHWVEKNVDWCLSRQLWWGHRIPVWYRGDEVKCQIDSPGDDWEQDPDVLDTWFSSWLWPFETMDAATERKFYPTDDLVTGPDIIFLWVARMIMAGLEFRGKKPFNHVFFTSLIRDIHGHKMSKSLGNSPNPLDLIDKYGADGLRFGLMRIAPQGQDVRFDEKQIEEGRNFANKLWNAVRFRQMQGASMPDPRLDGLQLSPYSIDILARLDELIGNVETAYCEYRFGEIAQLLYDFFWSQYCDWYVEASKTEVFSGSESSRNSALTVMDYVISRLLRLLHPFMPHITEELWETLGYTTENCGLASRYLMYAAWPTAPATAGLPPEIIATARTETAAVYKSVHAVRNLRAEYRIPSNRKVRFILKGGGDWISREIDTFARLTNADQVNVEVEYVANPGVPRVLTDLGEIYMPLEGLIDIQAELSRLEKEIEKTQSELQKVVKKLSNEKFTSNAPAEVVAEHRQREADWKSRLKQLRKMKKSLEE